jgi:thiamine biosynthesis protein ThiS
MTVSVFVGCNQHVMPAGMTVADVLVERKLNPLITAVVLNSQVIRGDGLTTTILKDGDVVECLVPCAGGDSVGDAPTSAATREVVLVHQGTGDAPDFAASLRAAVGPDIRLSVIDVTTATGSLAFPPALLKSVQLYGSHCLPALVVDGVVVRQGRLPTPTEALHLIDRPEADPATDLELDRLLEVVNTSSSSSCCSGGCACN